MKTGGISIGKTEYHETSRGVAYDGQLFMDGKEIGAVTYSGDGGYTRVAVIDDKNYAEFKKRMLKYFKDVGMEVTGSEQQYSLEYTFAEHLMDYKETGKLDSTRDLDFLV